MSARAATVGPWVRCKGTLSTAPAARSGDGNSGNDAAAERQLASLALSGSDALERSLQTAASLVGERDARCRELERELQRQKQRELQQ